MVDGFGPVVEQVRTSMSSASRFIDYLLTLETNLELSRLTHRVDPAETERYIDLIKTALWRQVELSSRIGGIIPEDKQTAFSAAVKRFTRDVMAPDDIVINQYLFLNTPATLPEDLHYSYRERWNQFKVTHRLFWEYYDARQIQMTALEYMLSLLGLAIVAKSADAYAQSVEDFFVRFPEAKTLVGTTDVIGGIYE